MGPARAIRLICGKPATRRDRASVATVGTELQLCPGPTLRQRRICLPVGRVGPYGGGALGEYAQWGERKRVVLNVQRLYQRFRGEI